MLIENEYRVVVGFDRSGSIEYGKNADAVYGVDDGVCNSFCNGEQVIGDDGKSVYDLIVWLDKLMPDDTNHVYAPHVSKRKISNNVE